VSPEIQAAKKAADTIHRIARELASDGSNRYTAVAVSRTPVVDPTEQSRKAGQPIHSPISLAQRLSLFTAGGGRRQFSYSEFPSRPNGFGGNRRARSSVGERVVDQRPGITVLHLLPQLLEALAVAPTGILCRGEGTDALT
jgi:hypothetical protein